MAKKRRNYQSHEPCLRCEEEYRDRCYHHVMTKGSGGSDHECNLMSLCDSCHTKESDSVHELGLTRFAETSPAVENWLIQKGWDFDSNVNKWRAPQEAYR